ncbi:MAG: protein arginine kinase [Phycisphaerales bacterium]|nr:protein arginine kinase [Phycisphaerales bacterium]
MSSPLDQVVRQAGEWLRGVGPLHEIVISTRIRLARNLRGIPFLSKASEAARQEIVDIVTASIRRSELLRDFILLDVSQLDELDRSLLVERHLISRQHAEGSGPRAVAFHRSEASAIMVNEEDHLRIQTMRSGLQIDEAWAEMNRLDDALEQNLDYAFHPQYGYLTACPTNVGTGIRVSVMLHLPALRLTNELEKVAQAAKAMQLAVRGLHGEGTEALGDFFQISNQITLGRSEEEIIEDFRDKVIPEIVKFELQTREALKDKRPYALDDKIWRALGTLRSARLISSQEAMQYLSHVRMGVHVGRVDSIDVKTLNELFLQIQPAHLQKLHGERLTGEQRSVERATFIRSRLHAN